MLRPVALHVLVLDTVSSDSGPYADSMWVGIEKESVLKKFGPVTEWRARRRDVDGHEEVSSGIRGALGLRSVDTPRISIGP